MRCCSTADDLLKASDDELIEIRRHKMGMVFQNFGLLPHLTVLENVAFPLRVQGKTKSEREARAQEMVSLVGLEGRENAFPRQLSGGQQQRVGIARSLAVEPELWFLDEPFSALDPLIRRQMQDEFLRLQKMLHKTIVFITHDFLEALRLADRIVIMKDGRVVQMGTPADLVLRPADDYVAEFTKDVPRVRVITAGRDHGGRQARQRRPRPGQRCRGRDQSGGSHAAHGAPSRRTRHPGRRRCDDRPGHAAGHRPRAGRGRRGSRLSAGRLGRPPRALTRGTCRWPIAPRA